MNTCSRIVIFSCGPNRRLSVAKVQGNFKLDVICKEKYHTNLKKLKTEGWWIEPEVSRLAFQRCSIGVIYKRLSSAKVTVLNLTTSSLYTQVAFFVKQSNLNICLYVFLML